MYPDRATDSTNGASRRAAEESTDAPDGALEVVKSLLEHEQQTDRASDSTDR